MKKRILTILVLMLLFSVPASADIYTEQYETSGAGSLYETLPDDVKEFFDDLEIDPSSGDWVNKVTAGNVFTMLLDSLKENGRAPLTTATAVIAVVLLLAAFRGFADKPEMETVMSYISTVTAAGVVLVPVFGIITSTVRSIKAGAQFMLSFVPVYCTVLVASGKPATGAASGGLLLAVSEGVVQLSSNIITPIIGSYLAVCMCSSVSPVLKTSGVAELMKKSANWIMGFIMTVYIGILGIQTTVNAAADNLAVKTGKFMIGSFVPVVGAPISEALTTVQSCVSLLKSSVGIYGVVVLALILLPTILELALWRISLLLSAVASSMFECDKVAAILRSADAAVSFLMGILLLNSVAFIISLTILTTAGG